MKTLLRKRSVLLMQVGIFLRLKISDLHPRFSLFCVEGGGDTVSPIQTAFFIYSKYVP